MIDATSGGALGNLTTTATRQLMENMASNYQQFGTRHDAIVVRGIHDVRAAEYTKKLVTKIDVLTTLVNQLATNQRTAPSTTRVCGIFMSVDNFTYSCPTLKHATTYAPSHTPQAYAANIFNNRSPNNTSKTVICPLIDII